MCFHTANAWEEGPNTIRLFLCAFREFRWGPGGGGAGQAIARSVGQGSTSASAAPRLACHPA